MTAGVCGDGWYKEQKILSVIGWSALFVPIFSQRKRLYIIWAANGVHMTNIQRGGQNGKKRIVGDNRSA